MVIAVLIKSYDYDFNWDRTWDPLDNTGRMNCPFDIFYIYYIFKVKYLKHFL